MREVVYGRTPAGVEYWWCIETERAFTREGAGGVYELLVGMLCPDHGLGHMEYAGDAISLVAAIEWVSAEELEEEDSPLVH
jgi:hypothetical protein